MQQCSSHPPSLLRLSFFFYSPLRDLRAKKSDTTCLPLPSLAPSSSSLSSLKAHCLPRGLFIYGGRRGGEGRRGTSLFRFGPQQWTSVCGDGLLQHMVPTCLSSSFSPSLKFSLPPPPSFATSLCLDFFAYSCFLPPCLTQTHWPD